MMDFISLCKKVDMDSIKAKLRPLPAFPALKNVKLPNSLSKLKSRKIFQSHRGDVKNDLAEGSEKSTQRQKQLPPPPPSDFMNYTPTRISTISSLMDEENIESNRGSISYRSAETVDDDYSMPPHQRNQTAIEPISPILLRDSAANRNVPLPITTPINRAESQQSFTQLLNRRYKELTDFKLKHIFAKKTVVRKDNIEVEDYVQRYNDDIAFEKAENERRDKDIGDNYCINFTLSRQNTLGSNDSVCEKATATDHRNMVKIKTVSEDSGDESGMEISPPIRKPGIASTRFSKVLNPVKRMSLEYDEEVDRSTNEETPARNKTIATNSGNDQFSRNKFYNAEPELKTNVANEKNFKMNDFHFTASTDSLSTIKDNCKRFRQTLSRRRPHHASTDESFEADSPTNEIKSSTTVQKLKTKLKHFHSKEDIDNDSPNNSNNDATSTISNKFQIWKNSLKRIDANKKHDDNKENIDKPTTTENDENKAISSHKRITNKLQKLKMNMILQRSENGVDDSQNNENAESIEKGKRSDTLIRKLKYIRARKSEKSVEEYENDSSANHTDSKNCEVAKPKNFEEKFNQRRQLTMRKVNDKMQQLKIFQNPKESKSQPSDSKTVKKATEDFHSSPCHVVESNDSSSDNYGYANEYTINNACAKWTTKPIFKESMDTDDGIGDYPRVLIHQDNSDYFESTLIISVTRGASRSPSPKLTEISQDDTDYNEAPQKLKWISNEDIITGFDSSDMSNKSNNTVRRASNVSVSNIAPLAEYKMRSSSAADVGDASDPWIANGNATKSAMFKCKSIDIFDANKMSIATAFDNFDEELCNEPVVKISNLSDDLSPYNMDNDENSDAPDDDNSSRVTKIYLKNETSSKESVNDITSLPKLARFCRIGNSQESLITQAHNSIEYVSNDDDDSDDDSNRPPSAAPSPPPIIPPTPPPVPERRITVKSTEQNETAFNTDTYTSPILPHFRPTLPKCKPTRSNSMSNEVSNVPPMIITTARRPLKPLVKTSSLRLSYSEQVKITDVGKVNKLISQFEQPKQTEHNAYKVKDDKHTGNIPSNELHKHMPCSTSIKLTLTTPPPRTIKSAGSSDHGHHEKLLSEDGLCIITSDNDIEKNDVDEFNSPSSSSKNSINLDNHYSFSCPNSEYGSPLTYPSSVICSPDTTPINDRRIRLSANECNTKQKRRSVTRESENYYSFDSDEENSYYSISSSNSSRYVVEI